MIKKLLSTLILFSIFAMMPGVVSATEKADLPPRPIPPVQPESGAFSSEWDGAKLILIAPLDANVGDKTWTRVQWQAKDGRWHDVIGWQGTFYLNEKSMQWEVEWWVGRSHFGDGPFQWVIDIDGKELATLPFYLPADGNWDNFVQINLPSTENIRK